MRILDSNESDFGEMRHILPIRAGGDNPNGGWRWRAPKLRARLVRSDSIKGLAQSIAKPAYRRLLTAEPALRRAVPALIIAFLLTICVGAFVQILDHRRQSIAELAHADSKPAPTCSAERIDRACAPSKAISIAACKANSTT